MRKTFNINLVLKDCESKVLFRGVLKRTIRIKNIYPSGSDVIIKSGEKGWVERRDGVITFELDEPIPFENSDASCYRVVYRDNVFKFNRDIQKYEASNEERIDYTVKHLKSLRSINGLESIDTNLIKTDLDEALLYEKDLDKAVENYLKEIQDIIEKKHARLFY